MIKTFRSDALWPPVVPTVVLIESLPGRSGQDANLNRFLKTCILDAHVPEALGRRAAELRGSKCGSAVDALVVALAEPGGTVLTTDADDLEGLAAHARGVSVERV